MVVTIQLIKFRLSCAPEGGLRQGENFWLHLTTASAHCLRLSEHFFIVDCEDEKRQCLK